MIVVVCCLCDCCLIVVCVIIVVLRFLLFVGEGRRNLRLKGKGKPFRK